MSGLRRSGGTYSINAKLVEYSLCAKKSYPWGALPIQADGYIGTCPVGVWFKTRGDAIEYAKYVNTSVFPYGYAIAKAHL